MTRELTGRHVLIIAICAFATIVGANLAMLFAATGSFPGLVVRNAYVASQGWNARTSAQQDLGIRASVSYGAGVLRVAMSERDGSPAETGPTTVSVGRPADARTDKAVAMTRRGHALAGSVELAPGVWQIRINARDGAWTATAQLYVDAP